LTWVNLRILLSAQICFTDFLPIRNHDSLVWLN